MDPGGTPLAALAPQPCGDAQANQAEEAQGQVEDDDTNRHEGVEQSLDAGELRHEAPGEQEDRGRREPVEHEERVMQAGCAPRLPQPAAQCEQGKLA